MENIFILSIDKKIVKVHPSKLTSNYKDYINNELYKLYNGKCSNNGFIKPNSIKIKRITSTEIEKFSFKGYVNFEVEFYYEICKIPNNIQVVCQVEEQNDFGLKCNFTYFEESLNTNLTICEVYVPRNASNKINSTINLSTVDNNDKVLVEILRSDFSIGELSLRAVGKIIKKLDSNYSGKIYMNNNIDIKNNDIVKNNDSDMELSDIEDIHNELSESEQNEISDNEDDEKDEGESENENSDEENSDNENEDEEDGDNENIEDEEDGEDGDNEDGDNEDGNDNDDVDTDDDDDDEQDEINNKKNKSKRNDSDSD
jgi:DNA-directed RNA polymerase subunit E'/Rpb7